MLCPAQQGPAHLRYWQYWQTVLPVAVVLCTAVHQFTSTPVRLCRKSLDHELICIYWYLVRMYRYLYSTGMVLYCTSNLRFPQITSKVTGQVTVFADPGISESHFLSA